MTSPRRIIRPLSASSRTRRTLVPLGVATLLVAEVSALGLAGCSSTVPPAATGGATATGGSTSSGGALPGSGGAPASGGAVGSGGVVGSGGIAASGGTVGSGGDAGSTGGAVGSGGAGSGGQSGGDCSSLPVCDDFESVTAGMPPDATVELGWSNDVQFASNVQVSAGDAHSPPQAVLISGNDTAPWIFQYTPPGETFYARAYFKTGDPGSSGTILIGVGATANHDPEIRLRLFDGKVMLNSASNGDGLAPGPNCTDCLDVPIDTWFCAEMFYDSTTDTARVWIEEELVAEVVENVGWHSSGAFPPAAERVWFGTLAPNGPAPDVLIDDVAVGTEPIGCF